MIIAAILGAVVPVAAANWAHDLASADPDYAESRAICRILKTLPLPAADMPDRTRRTTELEEFPTRAARPTDP